MIDVNLRSILDEYPLLRSFSHLQVFLRNVEKIPDLLIVNFDYRDLNKSTKIQKTKKIQIPKSNSKNHFRVFYLKLPFNVIWALGNLIKDGSHHPGDDPFHPRAVNIRPLHRVGLSTRRLAISEDGSIEPSEAGVDNRLARDVEYPLLVWFFPEYLVESKFVPVDCVGVGLFLLICLLLLRLSLTGCPRCQCISPSLTSFRRCSLAWSYKTPFNFNSLLLLLYSNFRLPFFLFFFKINLRKFLMKNIISLILNFIFVKNHFRRKI